MNLSYQKGIRIGTWNIRTLAQASRLAQLSREMTRCKIKILGLSEVRWKNSGDITTSDNHYMIYSGNSTTHINGVGIVISTKIKKSLMEWNPVSDRLITLVVCVCVVERDGGETITEGRGVILTGRDGGVVFAGSGGVVFSGIRNCLGRGFRRGSLI
ncbi:Craniofacial development protein 2 [Cyphomyrmex costatus]|uniref:Craniofacial development protein 2 n=1 Tax=Cyphomyrmex costatus TaxID=456900 RepID=A0A151IMW9_9HYME|nr:Craniofacial development protein 2 [Cyphomyrmex costatus]